LIYAAFVLWLSLILGMGLGVYRLWSQLLRPIWVNWAILPGTVVSEIAYIVGCLITGGEVDQAKLMDGGSGSRKKSSSKSEPKSKRRLRTAGSVLAILVSILACAGGILVVHHLLGRHVTDQLGSIWSSSGELPEDLPMTWPAFWGQLSHLVHMQRQACEALPRLEWTRWEVVLFVYLSMCLAIRLTPMRGSARQKLAAVLLIAGIVAVVAGLVPQSREAVQTVWPLLTYVWTSLLTVLLASLVLCGAITVIRVVAGTRR
jgi:hypothetical protein